MTHSLKCGSPHSTEWTIWEPWPDDTHELIKKHINIKQIFILHIYFNFLSVVPPEAKYATALLQKKCWY